MTDLRHKSIDIAIELCKQIITLSSAVIGLSAGILKDAKTPTITLIAASFCAIISIVLGLVFLMSMVTEIEKNYDSIDIYKKNITIPASIQVVFFILCLIFLIIYIL
ncbi:hypothetical protein [Nitrospirillum sp. BR 11163]|uniref:hypothetical protein n=1 Tax=Nitrospirillum sp. BR 11163 TaxID=3104323 RepID=UPI002AFF8794|nr:hypothetical protein [Nitrospirillum sp. BR 11163]MEA1672999.1 hypothetical protein [Nitrospirillum sp. BR 11163]